MLLLLFGMRLLLVGSPALLLLHLPRVLALWERLRITQFPCTTSMLPSLA
jgi:hypothetical protein